MSSNQSPEKDVTTVLASLKSIAEAVMLAAEAGNLEQVLQQIAHVTQQIVHARYVALGVPDETGVFKFFKVVGVSPKQIEEIGHLPVGKGLLGVILHERKVLRLEHMQSHPKSGGFPPHHPHMTSLLGVPIVLGTHLFGIFYLSDREDGQPFSELDEWLVETLAGYAALAIGGVELSDNQARLRVLEERERIGMELHDGVIQSLYAIGMQMQLMRLTNKVPEVEMGHAIHNLDEVIEDIRRYILNLKVNHYQQKTIYKCLHEMLDRLHIPDNLIIEIDAPDRLPPFAPPVVEAVCQIAQEAISNVIRHASASAVALKVFQNDNSFQMTVQDNGNGFDVKNANNFEGLGLRNIQRRAQIHGGNVHIDSVTGEGTRLTLTMPAKKF